MNSDFKTYLNHYAKFSNKDFDEIMSVKLEYIEDTLEDFGEVNLLTDYFTAKEIISEYSIYDYSDYVGIDLQSDVPLYLVSIVEGELFNVETMEKKNGKYKFMECDNLTIDDDINCLVDKELLECMYAEEITVLKVIEE